MKIGDIFLGKPMHWALWVVIGVVFLVLGSNRQHVRDFVPFALELLVLAVFCMAVIILTYKPGDRVTREPFEEDGEE